MRKRRKAFDCVEMQHRGAEHVRRLTEGMTPEEELEFWRRGTEELRREVAEAKARVNAAASKG